MRRYVTDVTVWWKAAATGDTPRDVIKANEAVMAMRRAEVGQHAAQLTLERETNSVELEKRSAQEGIDLLHAQLKRERLALQV